MDYTGFTVLQIARTGVHFDVKQQTWFLIIDRTALLLPTQGLNALITGGKHKRRNKITFQFLNISQRNHLGFFKDNARIS